MPLNFLIGRRGLDTQLRHAEDFAHSMYNPSQLRPLQQGAEQLATEGIGASADLLRTGMIGQLFQEDIDPARLGGQAQAMAFLGQRDAGRSQALAEGELQIGMLDEEARREGRGRAFEVAGRMTELQAQREAAISEARMQVEAEAGSRRQAMLGSLLGIGSAVLGGPVGGAIGKTLGGLFGRGGEQQTPTATQVPRTQVDLGRQDPQRQDIIGRAGVEDQAFMNMLRGRASNLFN